MTDDSPNIQLRLNESKSCYDLLGFDEFDTYASQNSPTWSYIKKVCRDRNISSDDCIKMIAIRLFKQNKELESTMRSMVERSVSQVMVIPPDEWEVLEAKEKVNNE